MATYHGCYTDRVKSRGDEKSGHRTEARIVEVLRASDGPLAVTDLAESLGMHPNGIRNHLQRLQSRGLVAGYAEKGSVGRPRFLWSATPRAVAEAELPHTGWAMARSLARSIPATPQRLAEIELSGVEMGRELVDDMGSMHGEEDRVQAALRALGFDPAREDSGATVRYTLRTCPYSEAVKENPEVVCTLHKGIIRGVLDRVQPESAISGFEPRPPDVAGCMVEISTADETGDRVDR